MDLNTPKYLIGADGQPVITHFSNSQLTKPQSLWVFEMLKLGSRRKDIKFGIAAEAGGAIHDAVQELATNADNVWADAVIETAKNRILDFETDNEVDEGRKHYLAEVIDQYVFNGVDALQEAVGDELIGAEVELPIDFQPESLDVPIIGYCDLVTENYVVELKTKSPRAGRQNKDGVRRYSPTKLPAEPLWAHLTQVGLYSAALNKKPILIYINEEEYQIFTEDNCPQLSPQSLRDHLGALVHRAVVRQNLLKISNDPDVLVNYLDFDFGDFRWNIGQEFLNEAKDWVFSQHTNL